MPTIRNEARSYESKKVETKNISDLPKVSMDAEIHWEQFEYEGKEVKYAYVLIGNTKYRVPNSVLKQLKALDEVYGDKLQFYKVIKSGEGMETSYLVEKI